MTDWKTALNIFLREWKENIDVIGALVCGSHVTGNPSQYSDIDVHIILADSVDWRERGNKVVEGYLIEYFVNPPKQIRRYFQEDYRDYRSMSMVQFLTGRILFDKEGVIGRLRQEAQEWIDKPYEDQNSTLIELRKYAIWDMQDCVERDRVDFSFVYHNSLQILFSHYCEFLRLESIPYYQILSYLTDSCYLDKYLKKPFPDADFAKIYIKAIQEKDSAVLLGMYNSLTEHVLEKMGGFQIDGWKVRSAVEGDIVS